MTKRDGLITGKTAHFERYGSKASPSNSRGNEFLEGDLRPGSPSKNNPQTQRFSLGGCNDGNFNVYRDSRSAPNSVPGSASGSRANSRPGSRPGSRLQSRCNSQESIIDLFDSMTLKYGQALDGSGPIEFKTPKPKRLAYTKMSYIDRVRINSAVWRSWHMQYIKKRKSAVCQFSSPLPETSTRLVSDVIQGRTALTGYKPEELGAVVRNYNKWRTFSKDVLAHRPVIQHSTPADSAEDHAIDLNSPHPPLSPGTGGKLVNDDLFKDFADTLFISRKKKHFTVPAPKKVTHMINYIPEYLQGDLSTLLPEVDDTFMNDLKSFEEILSKTPVKNDPRQLGLMDEVPNALYFSQDNFNSLMDVDMPQVIQAAGSSQYQTFPNFSYSQSPSTPQKSVSFSAPTTPHESASSSPGYQLPTAYDFSGPVQGFQQDNQQQQQQQPLTSHQPPVMQTMSNYNNSFQGTTEELVRGQGVSHHLVHQHPVLLQTLNNAPSLPQSSANTISTHNVTMRSDTRSPASSTPSPSGHKTPETKLEPVSPSNSACMGGASPVVTKPNNTISVGNFTYRLGDTTSNLSTEGWPNDKPKEIQWNTLTTTSGGGQGFEDLGSQLVTIMDNMGHHTISVCNNQIISTNRVPIFPAHASGGGDEPMDYGQFQQLVPQPSGGFRQPADVSMGSGLRSPGGSKRQSAGQIPASPFDAAINRKKSSGGLEHAMQSPRDEREAHPKSIPSSSHASNASSAASSPGNDENFETYYNSTKRKNRDNIEDKDDRALRRKRKHLDSEHKRRYNITSCLEELQKVIPNMNNGNPSRDQNKISTALLLQRAQEYIHALQDQKQALATEEEELKRKIEMLNTEIEQCQDALPDTGAPVNSQNDAQLYQMLDEYIDEEMEKSWKFWLFSKFARPLFKSFLSALKASTGASISADLITWVEESCRLRQLRPLAVSPVRQISKETSVLTDPSNLPEQVQEIARRESLARKNTPPPNL
ncbi:MLX-interacting protein [Holothuria leucospilota]|uniref:MLX-interacting protein n=1 Tax=Holothuria leucospilota TaxID=206669 RepID=A0A9Q1BQ79_HOLLE|nr:MLX-interacting protein [Holothuria leucospilota]